MFDKELEELSRLADELELKLTGVIRHTAPDHNRGLVVFIVALRHAEETARVLSMAQTRLINNEDPEMDYEGHGLYKVAP